MLTRSTGLVRPAFTGRSRGILVRRARPERAGLTRSKHWSAAGNQLDEQYHQRQNQQQMNESSQRVGSNNSQQPQNKEEYKDCPKHVVTSWALRPLPWAPTTEAWTRLLRAGVARRRVKFEADQCNLLIRGGFRKSRQPAACTPHQISSARTAAFVRVEDEKESKCYCSLC